MLTLLWTTAVWCAAAVPEAEALRTALQERRLLEAEGLWERLPQGEKSASLRAALAEAWLREGNYARSAQELREALQAAGEETPPERKKEWEQTQVLAELAASVPSQTRVKQEPAVVEAPRDKMGLRRVAVGVNGVTQAAVWDTGANLSTVTETTATRLGLTRLPGTVEVGTSTGGVAQAGLAVAEEVSVGGTQLRSVLFIVLPDANLSFPQVDYHIEAILGFPVLEALGTVRFEEGTQLRIGVENAVETPANLRFDGLTPLLQVRLGGQERWLLLDSGATQTELAPEAWAGVEPAPAVVDGGQAAIGGAAGVVAVGARQVTAVTLEIGGRAVHLPAVYYGRNQKGAEGTVGVLGNDALQVAGPYEIDLRRRVLRFCGPVAP